MYLPQTLNLSTANEVLRQGLQAIAAGQKEFNLGQLSAVDSSAVAVLLNWKRVAQENNAQIAFIDMPNSLTSLIALYGVSGLL